MLHHEIFQSADIYYVLLDAILLTTAGTIRKQWDPDNLVFLVFTVPALAWLVSRNVASRTQLAIM